MAHNSPATCRPASQIFLVLPWCQSQRSPKDTTKGRILLLKESAVHKSKEYCLPRGFRNQLQALHARHRLCSHQERRRHFVSLGVPDGCWLRPAHGTFLKRALGTDVAVFDGATARPSLLQLYKGATLDIILCWRWLQAEFGVLLQGRRPL